MFCPGIVELQSFYSSPLGQVACRLIRAHIKEFWPETGGADIIGAGYAAPYLLPFLDKSSITVALMPARQGVSAWPGNSPNLACLTEDSSLPLRDNSFNLALAVHALENSGDLEGMMEELWRILVPGGKLLIVVPNRAGLWSKSDATPFGHGRPFSHGQISRLLKEHSFVPGKSGYSLFFPPSSSRFCLRTSRIWEKIGRRFFEFFGGVLLVEAEKQVFAAVTSRPTKKGAMVRIPVAQPTG